MQKFNLDKLVKVKVNDFHLSHWFHYLKHKPKKYFWQSEWKEGVYTRVMEWSYIGEIPINYALKAGLIYEKPEVKMYFQGGVEAIKYFDSLSEAKVFAELITVGKNWLLN
tara:strand:+ start:798 stop:1127 length:330 start_codon:yes stop_codon:yes gene_type:complete